MKKEYGIIAGLLLVAVVIWHFFNKSSMGQSGGYSVTPATPAPDLSSANNYPNAQPIQMGNIDVGSSPLNITYNYAPPQDAISVSSGGCAGCNKRGQCSQLSNSTPQSNLVFNGSNLQTAVENLNQFVDKGTPAISSIRPALGVRFSG